MREDHAKRCLAFIPLPSDLANTSLFGTNGTALNSIDSSRIRSVLIVRLSAIGDVIHALPVLAALREGLPAAKIGWIVEEVSAPLLEGHPHLDKLYRIPRRRWRGKSLLQNWNKEVRPYFREVAAEGWDVTLDLQGLTKSALAAYGSGAKSRIGFGGADGREFSTMLNNIHVPADSRPMHVVEKNLSLLHGLGLKPSMQTAGLVHVLQEEIESMRGKLRELGWGGEPLMGMNPGAGWVTKRWPPAEFGELARFIHARDGLRPLIVWGPGEEELAGQMRDAMAGLNPIMAPRTTLRELSALTALLRLFVGGDTGPTHLAAALGIPTLSIFGASDPHRNRPWPPSPNALISSRHDLACVPCWKTKCPLSGDEHLGCLRGLTANRVFELYARTPMVYQEPGSPPSAGE